MDLPEVTDDMIDNLILRMPTDRKTATEAVLLSLAWLANRGLLTLQADDADCGECERYRLSEANYCPHCLKKFNRTA